MGGIAFGVLYSGQVKVIERVMVGLVGLMSIVFVSTMLLSSPDWAEVVRGLMVPGIPAGEVLLVVGLIGTTVVPYNLFLHASVVQERYAGAEDLADMRRKCNGYYPWRVNIRGIVITSATNVRGVVFNPQQIWLRLWSPCSAFGPNMY